MARESLDDAYDRLERENASQEPTHIVAMAIKDLYEIKKLSHQKQAEAFLSSPHVAGREDPRWIHTGKFIVVEVEHGRHTVRDGCGLAGIFEEKG